MVRKKQPDALTVSAVRALPWPAATKEKDHPLTVTDCYHTGRIVLEQLNWTETRGRQDWSLRRLQSQVLKNASVSTLSRCVRVYKIARELAIKPPWKNMDMRHFVATASLPPAKRKQLLRKVEAQGWSVMKLEQFVRENYGSPGRGGKTIVECVRALESFEKRDMFADLNRLNLLSKTEVRKIAKRAEAAEGNLRRLRKELMSFGA